MEGVKCINCLNHLKPTYWTSFQPGQEQSPPERKQVKSGKVSDLSVEGLASWQTHDLSLLSFWHIMMWSSIIDHHIPIKKIVIWSPSEGQTSWRTMRGGSSSAGRCSGPASGYSPSSPAFYKVVAIKHWISTNIKQSNEWYSWSRKYHYSISQVSYSRFMNKFLRISYKLSSPGLSWASWWLCHFRSTPVFLSQQALKSSAMFSTSNTIQSFLLKRPSLSGKAGEDCSIIQLSSSHWSVQACRFPAGGLSHNV